MVVTVSAAAKEGTRDFDDNRISDMDTQEVGMEQKQKVSVAFTSSYLSMKEERLNNDERKTPPSSCEDRVLREVTGQFAKLKTEAEKQDRMTEWKKTVGERTARQRSVRVFNN